MKKLNFELLYPSTININHSALGEGKLGYMLVTPFAYPVTWIAKDPAF